MVRKVGVGLKLGRKKREPSGKSRDRRMKKALAGPAKPAARKKPKRRAMIATVGRRISAVAAAVAGWERRIEQKLERRLGPPLRRWGRRLGTVGRRWSGRIESVFARLGRLIGRRLRPIAAFAFRILSAIDKRVRRAGAWTARAATGASAVLTPERGAAAVVVAAAACLVVSQFVDYRAVEIGQPGYEGLPAAANAPTVAVRSAGSAHAYLLIPLAIVAACLAVLATRPRRRRLGPVVFGLGLIAVAVILLIDLPAGLDAGSQKAMFAGATAVLDNGFYAELVASAVIALGGLLLAPDPQRRVRKSSLGRTQGGRRSAPTKSVRKQDNRPRTPPDEGLQRSAAIVRRRA
jgi:hypothetical protein